MKFRIAIEETLVQEFDIEAEDAGEAMELAEAKYKSGELVLTSAEVHHKQMAIVAPDNEATEWSEF